MSDLPVHEETFDGVTVIARQLDCLKAGPMWLRIYKVISPVLENIHKLDKKVVEKLTAMSLDELASTDVVAAITMMGPLLAPLGRELDIDMLMRVARELLAGSIAVKGDKRHDLNTDEAIRAVFGPDLGTFVRAAFFVGRVNFQSLFKNAPRAGRSPGASRST